MNRIKILAAFFASALLLSGCNTTEPGDTYKYNPKKPWAWVHDECGDSARVNWNYDPSHPGDEEELIFDSVTVSGLRILDYPTHSDTIRTKIKVGVGFSNLEWSLELRNESFPAEETGKPYEETFYSYTCFTYNVPKITQQPVNIAADDGDVVTFSVTASDGTKDVDDFYLDHNTYYWYRNGVLLVSDNPYLYTYNSPQLGWTTTLSDNGAKFKVVVDNGFGTVTSKEVTLTVKAAPPYINDIRAFKLELLTGDTVSDYDSLFAGSSLNLRAIAYGTITSYAWFYKGVSVGTSSPTLSLSNLQKADSGSIVRCIVGNTLGYDTTQVEIVVHSTPAAPWTNLSFGAGLPTSPYYGSLLDLDTGAQYVDNFQGDMVSKQGRIDLVVGIVSGSTKLLAPRLARKMNISSTTSLDSNQMAVIKMVLFTGNNPNQNEAAALYAQGTKVDSVTFGSSSGYFQGNAATKILLKTSSGRLFIIKSPVEVYESYFGIYGLRGSLP